MSLSCYNKTDLKIELTSLLSVSQACFQSWDFKPEKAALQQNICYAAWCWVTLIPFSSLCYYLHGFNHFFIINTSTEIIPILGWMLIKTHHPRCFASSAKVLPHLVSSAHSLRNCVYDILHDDKSLASSARHRHDGSFESV